MTMHKGGKLRSFIANIISDVMPSKYYRHNIRDIINFGIINYIISSTKCRLVQEKESEILCDHFFSICAIVKDEGPYFKEWLEFHRLMGVEKFYLYDNESTDNTKEVLEPYIKSGLVDYTYWPGKKQQMVVYADCIRRHKDDTRWLALIDLDEFLLPATDMSIPSFLKSLPSNISQIVIGWVVYGSSHHLTQPEGLVIENYKYRMDKQLSWAVKSIIKPRLCWRADVHRHQVIGKTIDENMTEIRVPYTQQEAHVTYNKFRINHYHCKSWQEYQHRSIRGSGNGINGAQYTRDFFDHHDCNDIYDPIMERWVEPLKRSMRLTIEEENATEGVNDEQ